MKTKFKWVSFWVFALILGFSVFLTPTNKASALNCPDGSTENLSSNICENSNGDSVEPLGETPCLRAGPGYSPSDNYRCVKPGAITLCQDEYTFVGSVCTPDPDADQGMVDATGRQNASTASMAVSPALGDTEITGCDDLYDFFKNPGTCALYSFGSIILWVLSMLVYLSAILFDFSVNVGIIQLSQYFASPSINAVWVTVRDLSNIVFIFFLLWISIATILQLDNAKKHLASIIMTALLINFSLFFTKVIIDTSNIVALQFYSQIVDNTCSSTSYKGCVADKLVSNLKLASVFKLGQNANGSSSAVPVTLSNIIIVTVFGSIMLLVTAFVFIQAAFMFIARTIAFVLLAAVSPVAFIGKILPQTSSYAKDWWKNLTNQALVAPIFLLFVWIIISLSGSGGVFDRAPSTPNGTAQTASAFNARTGGMAAAGTAQNVTPQNSLSSGKSMADSIASGSMDSMGLIFSFFFLIGLMIMALKVTKEYSGKIGEMAVGFGTTALGMVAGGAGGFAMRNSLGKFSQMAARSEKLKNWSEKSGLGGFAGRMALSTAKFGQSTSFDARALGQTGIGKLAGSVGSAAGVGVSFGSASGEGGRKAAYDKAVKTKETARKEEAEALKAEIFPEDDKATIEKKKEAEATRLAQFAERTAGGTILDKVKNVATLSATATRGSTKASVGVAKELKKRQDMEANAKNRGDRVEAIKTKLGKTTEAEVIEHYQEEIKKAEEDLEKLLKNTDAKPEEIERAEKLVKLTKGKLSEFENNIKERDRLREALGKKPDDKK